MKILKTKKQKIGSLLMITYNLLGLVGVLGLLPKDPFYWDSTYSGCLILLTLPVSLVSFVYHLVGNSLYPVFIIQGIVLILSLLFINDLTKEKDDC
ncbi:hypothetical protein [Dysgonomonas sp. GY617]|uniref:hypothetical protein n=1 Tax=Dysgonomonas sp. GY617 TaxID=2780420 RepID=UPI0018832AE0|nr:hypothetical protein [Dysgonomonas sp. GY617]MBF0575447.1 hypothetical protein [Dysgonomonas sp. GY617]